MKDTYIIPPQYSERTEYRLGALAREVILRRSEPSEELGSKLKVSWWSRDLQRIDLIGVTVDGPYLLSMKSLGTSALNTYGFDQKHDKIEVKFDASTDLTELDLTQVPHDIERALLDSQSVADALPRDSPREVNREEAEEMFAILAAHHITGPRLTYPKHSLELAHEIPIAQTYDFDETMVGDWIDLTLHTPSNELSDTYEKLYEISKGTAFHTKDKAVFIIELRNVLTAFRDRLMTPDATEASESDPSSPEATS